MWPWRANPPPAASRRKCDWARLRAHDSSCLLDVTRERARFSRASSGLCVPTGLGFRERSFPVIDQLQTDGKCGSGAAAEVDERVRVRKRKIMSRQKNIL